jgi:hypothetical protein
MGGPAVLLRSRKGLNSKYKEPPTKVSASRTIATIGIDIGKNDRSVPRPTKSVDQLDLQAQEGPACLTSPSRRR